MRTNPSLLTDSFTLNKSLDVKCIFVQSLELYIKSGYWWSTETFFCSSINVCGLISGDLRETTISNLEEEWEISNSAKIFLVRLPVPTGSSQKKEDLTLKRLCWILVHQRQGKTLLDAWNFDQFYSDCKIKWNWVTSIFSKAKKIQKKGALATSLHKKWSFPLRISSVNVTKFAGNCEFGHIYWKKLLMRNFTFWALLAVSFMGRYN